MLKITTTTANDSSQEKLAKNKTRTGSKCLQQVMFCKTKVINKRRKLRICFAMSLLHVISNAFAKKINCFNTGANYKTRSLL